MSLRRHILSCVTYTMLLTHVYRGAIEPMRDINVGERARPLWHPRQTRSSEPTTDGRNEQQQPRTARSSQYSERRMCGVRMAYVRRTYGVRTAYVRRTHGVRAAYVLRTYGVRTAHVRRTYGVRGNHAKTALACQTGKRSLRLGKSAKIRVCFLQPPQH